MRTKSSEHSLMKTTTNPPAQPAPYKGKGVINVNPHAISIGDNCEETMNMEPTIQALAIKPLTVAKPGEPVFPTHPSILNHLAYTGGWKTLRYFRSTGEPYYTYTHEDHGTIRSLKKTLEILDSIHEKNMAEQRKQGSGTNQPNEGASVVGASEESANGKDATVANGSADAAVGGCCAKETPA